MTRDYYSELAENYGGTTINSRPFHEFEKIEKTYVLNTFFGNTGLFIQLAFAQTDLENGKTVLG